MEYYKSSKRNIPSEQHQRMLPLGMNITSLYTGFCVFVSLLNSLSVKFLTI